MKKEDKKLLINIIINSLIILGDILWLVLQWLSADSQLLGVSVSVTCVCFLILVFCICSMVKQINLTITEKKYDFMTYGIRK